jgi:hypothetical protein
LSAKDPHCCEIRSWRQTFDARQHGLLVDMLEGWCPARLYLRPSD